MFYIIAIILVVIGVAQLSFYLVRNARLGKKRKLLELNVVQSSVSVQSQTVAPVERMIQKSSKLVRLSDRLDNNLTAKATGFIGFSLLVFIVSASGIYPMSKNTMIIVMAIFLVFVIFVPGRIKNSIIQKRVRSISGDLPFIIDMMAVCVQSGMTIENALRYIADNTSGINPDIATLLERTMLKSEVSGIGAALEQLYIETPANEVRMLCSTLQQSIKYGSSIYQVLIDLSKEMRELQLLAVEEKVASLSAKMTIPMILFVMLPLLVVIAGPGIINMVQTWTN